MADDNSSSSPLTLGQLITGMALFGTATPLSKIIGEHYSVFTASCLRMVIASIVLAPAVWFLTDRYARVRRSDFAVIAGIAAVGMVGFTATMLYGMRLTTGVIGSTIMSASPAVTAMAAVVFFGAAMNLRKAGALALAVAGIVVINFWRGGGESSGNGSGGDALLLGAVLVLVAVCFEAAFTLLSRKLSDGITSLEATLAASLLAAPLFVPLAFAFDQRPFDLVGGDTGSLAALLFWGGATGGLAPVIWYNGVRKAPGALTAGAMAVMPLTALLTSYLLLGEAFRWVHLAGFGLVFTGLLLMIREHASDAHED